MSGSDACKLTFIAWEQANCMRLSGLWQHFFVGYMYLIVSGLYKAIRKIGFRPLVDTAGDFHHQSLREHK